MDPRGPGMGLDCNRLVWMLLFWGKRHRVDGLRFAQNTRGQSETTSVPLEIAKTRYAHGEITKEEFESVKRDIT